MILFVNDDLDYRSSKFYQLILDKDYILKKCPYLLSEMLSLAQQLYYLSHADKGFIFAYFWIVYFWGKIIVWIQNFMIVILLGIRF